MEKNKSLEKRDDRHSRAVVRLLKRGWELQEIEEAKSLEELYEVRFAYIVRLKNCGIPLTVIPEILDIRESYPALSGVLLYRCRKLCVNHYEDEEIGLEFFEGFLEVCAGLFQEAEDRLHTPVTRSMPFIFQRLMEYVEKSANEDIELVYRELVDDPETLLNRILEMSERSAHSGTQGRYLFPSHLEEDFIEINEDIEHRRE